MRAKLASTGNTIKLVTNSTAMPMAAVSASSRITGTGMVVTVTKVSTASDRATTPGSSSLAKLMRAASRGGLPSPTNRTLERAICTPVADANGQNQEKG